MRISAVIGQVPVGWSVERNLATIEDLLAETRPGEVVVLPEGALSGYGADLSPLRALDPVAVTQALDALAEQARARAVHLFCGCLLYERGAWCNAAVYFPPDGPRWIYRKINLAMNERGRLTPGACLPVLPVSHGNGGFSAGVQICREIRFPEQWQYLARAGADVFVYLTHAVNPDEPAGVWRSHLVSRAAENQRFVLAANVAHTGQHCPSMVVSPRGEVLGELAAGRTDILRVALDLDQVATWYLGQQRRDVVDLYYRDGPDRTGGPER